MGSSRDASVDHSSPRPDVGPTHGADATLPGADVTSSPDPSKKYPGYVWRGSPSLAPAECDLAKGEVCCTHTLFGGVPIRPSLCTPADASCTISVGCDEDADCPVGQRCISFIPGGFNSGSACEAPTDGAPHLPPPTDAAPPDAGNDFCSALAACTRFERDFPGQEGYSGGERVCGRDEHTCHVTVALIGGTVDRYSCELPPGFACDAAGNTPLDLTNPTICTRLPPCGGPDGGPACPSDLLSCDAAP